MKLMPPSYAKAYLKSSKNDGSDLRRGERSYVICQICDLQNARKHPILPLTAEFPQKVTQRKCSTYGGTRCARKLTLGCAVSGGVDHPSFALVFSLLAPGEGSAQQPTAPPAAGETTSIEPRTTEPSLERYRSREERLRAQPLDWNQTIGRPAEVSPGAATAAPAREQPGTTPEGAPDPDADERARREFPSEWRTEPQPDRRGGLNFPGITLPEAEIHLAGTPDTFTQFWKIVQT